MKETAAYFQSVLLALCLSLPALSQQNQPQKLSSLDRERAETMLDRVAADVRKHYYDPKFHGLDWDARIREAKQRIDASPSLNMAISHVAGALDSLNDSHTFFVPPARPYRHDYGFRMQMFGNHCYLIRVRPGSDAESKGLRAGDEVLSVNGFNPAREDFWRMEYVFNTLRPQPSLRMELRGAAGQRQVEVAAKMREGVQVKDLKDSYSDFERGWGDDYHAMRPHSVDVSDLMILKIPAFFFSEMEAGDLIGKARKHKALIIDLRSNPGGAEDSLKALIGAIFENEIKIGDRVRRNGSKPLVAKSRHKPFTGKLVILLDSNSASASELFARVVQMEKRGTIIGDQSSGSVMESEYYSYTAGFNVISFFGASITEADLIMTDGRSLEHVGVTPDEILLPTPTDLASGRDPVLAHAAETLGYKLTPEDAGKFFPYEWPKE